MNHRITCDIPGRLRIRYGNYSFSRGQAVSLEKSFADRDGVLRTEANHRCGSLLILYEGNQREALLFALHQLNPRFLPSAALSDVPERAEGGSGSGFTKKIVLLLAGRLMRRLFLPAPLRILITVIQSIHFWRRGLKALAAGKLNVEVLDASAVAAAFYQGDLSTAGSIIFLLRLSELLEERALHRTRALLVDSLRFHVDQVWILENGDCRSIPSDQLKAGMQVVVRTGGMIPVDGKVATGEAIVNESAMTGEPLGIFRKEGDSVFAGTVVEEGRLVILARTTEGDTRIRHIIRIVEQSDGFKSNLQGKADRFADKLVPLSFLTAAGVFAVTRDLSKALSVLFVDYSCAIRLSTSIAFLAAMREASEAGAIVKGGRFLEVIGEADTFVFDKTGTLTTSSPFVSGVVPFGDYNSQEVLRLAACIEEHFPHSVAKAIVKAARDQNLRHEEQHAEVKYIVAHGIATRIHGQKAVIGSRHFIFEDEGVPCDEEQRRKIEAEEDSLICMAVDGKLVGYITICDPPRPEAAEAIAALRKLGVKNMLMLTGDSETAAKRVAEACGMDTYKAGVLPEEKGVVIDRLRKSGHTVIMVGDGVNDSPALARADASVAMDGASDLARDVADIVLTRSDLMGLVKLRALSQSLTARIRKNYMFIGGFNTALIALGLANLITPARAALLHNLSTAAVSASSAKPCMHGDRRRLTSPVPSEDKNRSEDAPAAPAASKTGGESVGKN